MDTSDQWIRSRTGIGARYAMRQGESLAQIATEASRTALRYVVSRFFRNSPELLVLNLLEDEELSHKELGRIRALLAGEEL